MANRNIEIVNKAIEDYKKKMYSTMLQANEDICLNVLKAAIHFRKNAPHSHDFTGNLLNSIAVVLLTNSEVAKYTGMKTKFIYTASKYGNVNPEMMTMMSSNRGGSFKKAKAKKHQYYAVFEEQTTPGIYFFRRDYSWARNASYEATVETTNTYGTVMANKAAAETKLSSNKNQFEIHVVYAAPYAEFIEGLRRSTGISDAQVYAWELIQDTYPLPTYG